MNKQIIREALEEIVDLERRAHATGKYATAVEYAASVARRTIAELDPSAPQSARDLAVDCIARFTKGYRCETKEDYDYVMYEVVELIQSYADSKVQEALEKERAK